jgi:hypothetical protein
LRWRENLTDINDAGQACVARLGADGLEGHSRRGLLFKRSLGEVNRDFDAGDPIGFQHCRARQPRLGLRHNQQMA